MKANKDEVRTIDSSDGSIFNSRGYTIDSQMQMVEIAQFQDAHKMEVIKNTLANRNKLLLEECPQQINLAKMICSQYDPKNEHWKRVSELSSDISNFHSEQDCTYTFITVPKQDMNMNNGNKYQRVFLININDENTFAFPMTHNLSFVFSHNIRYSFLVST